MSAHYFVKWTGRFPNLCSGEWIVLRDGVDVSHNIPRAKRYNEPMNTFKQYVRVWLNGQYEEETELYSDGLFMDEWYAENKSWVDKICSTMDEVGALYRAIREQDWRHNSCGGCI